MTLGVTEPFTATLTVALAALLLSLPIILYQLYAFVLPAFTPRERRVALPLMTMVPFLFIAGVVFAYFVVLPPAIKFLQSYNNDSFDILVQAHDYYRFEILVMAMMALVLPAPGRDPRPHAARGDHAAPAAQEPPLRDRRHRRRRRCCRPAPIR